MKKTLWLPAATLTALLALVACSSSSNSGSGGGGAPTCKNPASTGAGSTACNSCLESNCSSQLSQVQANCQAYVSCYEGCQCNDVSCLLNCTSKVDSTCNSSAQAQAMCMQANCSQQCTTTVSVDAGTD